VQGGVSANERAALEARALAHKQSVQAVSEMCAEAGAVKAREVSEAVQEATHLLMGHLGRAEQVRSRF
jgi:hypothetical protein